MNSYDSAEHKREMILKPTYSGFKEELFIQIPVIILTQCASVNTNAKIGTLPRITIYEW